MHNLLDFNKKKFTNEKINIQKKKLQTKDSHEL